MGDAARAARRLGILGGSFDPPHAGHLFVARAAREAFDLDHVLFVPAARPPHKPGGTLAAGEDRRAMLALLLAAEPGASIWTGELSRAGPSYTVDTVRELAGLRPAGSELFLILGSDNLAGLGAWREADELVSSLARPIVVQRRGSPSVAPSAGATLSQAARDRLAAGFLELEPFDASSSELRERIGRGAAPGAALPPEVWEYVRARGIYGAR